MSTLGEAVLRGSSSAAQVAQRVRAWLAQLPDPASSQQPPPACGSVSRKTFSTLCAAITSELKARHFSSLSDLMRSLTILVQSNSNTSCGEGGDGGLSAGLRQILSFGLGRKIVEWLAGLRSMSCTGSMGWRQACVAMTTMVEEALEACGDKGRMLLLTTPLLEWVCVTDLPADARLASARCSANLLEVMEAGQKLKLFSKHSHLFGQLVDGLPSAGDFDLQATMVECCVSVLGESSGRSDHAHCWFSDHTLITAFMNIHESTFELDCREFLTLLNSKTRPEERSVHSFLCKTVLLGAVKLHAPRDAGQRGFWLDINSASHTLSLNVEDPYPPGPPGPQGGSDLWENVSVSNAVLKSWTITTDRGDVVLSLDLSSPSHTLLPSLPPSHHHTLTITLPPSHNPMLAMERVFPGKQATPTNLSPASTGPPLSPPSSVKSSVAIASLHIRQKQNSLHPLVMSAHRASGKTAAAARPLSTPSLKQISPIDVPPDTPAQGGHVSSQSSTTPTNCPIKVLVPHTSTPKQAVSRLQPTPAGTRPALQFSSGGVSKRSIAVSSIHITSEPASGGGATPAAASRSGLTRGGQTKMLTSNGGQRRNGGTGTPASGWCSERSESSGAAVLVARGGKLTSSSAARSQASSTRATGNSTRGKSLNNSSTKATHTDKTSDVNTSDKTSGMNTSGMNTSGMNTSGVNTSGVNTVRGVDSENYEDPVIVSAAVTGSEEEAAQEQRNISGSNERGSLAGRQVKPLSSSRVGLRDVTNIKPAVQTGAAGMERVLPGKQATPTKPAVQIEAGKRPRAGGKVGVAGRPRVGGATQRTFVLSHAPMIGAGTARGKARSKAGGGKTAANKKTNRDLVNAFDFKDSPGLKKTPPFSTPHSIPSSLPSPTAIPNSIPSQSYSRSPSTRRRSRLVLNSTLDSDRDSDPSWNGDISLSHQNLVSKKTLTGNTDNGWEEVRAEREGSSASSAGRKRQTPETPATLREDAAVASVVRKPSNQSGATKANKEISAKRTSNETKENASKATDKLTSEPASNETNAGRSRATDKLTSEPVHVVCRGRPGKSIATVTTAGSDSLAHSKAKSKTLLTTSRAYKKRSGPSDVGTSVTASKKKIVSDVGTSVTTSKKKIVSDVGTSITASKKKIVSDVGTFSAVKKGKVDNAVEEGRPASRAENGGKAGRGKAGMGTVKKTVSCDLTGVESAITAETPALPGSGREMRGKVWSGMDSTQGEEGLQSPTVSTLTLSPGRRGRERGRGTERGTGMERKKVTEKVYQPVDDEFDMPSVDSSSCSSTSLSAYSPSPQRGRGKRTEHKPLRDRQTERKKTIPHKPQRGGRQREAEAVGREKRGVKAVEKAEAPPHKRPRVSSGYLSLSHSLSPVSSHNDEGSEVVEEATPPAPPTPCSLHSSDAGPDLNLTTGFERICRDLVARAGGGSVVNHTSSPGHSEGCDTPTPPPHSPTTLSPTTLSQLTRRLVRAGEGEGAGEGDGAGEGAGGEAAAVPGKKTAGRAARLRGKATPTKAVKPVRDGKGKSLATSHTPSVSPVTPVVAGDRDVAIPVSGSGEAHVLSSLLQRVGSRKRKSSDWGEEEEEEEGVGVLRSAASSVKYPAVAMETHKPVTKKACKRSSGSSVAMAMKDKLDGVWREQLNERQGLLSSHGDRLTNCLVSMETALGRCWSRQEKGVEGVRQRQQTMEEAGLTTQRGLEKLQSVLSVFHTEVTNMERRQGQQSGVVQRGLRREMQLLQKKMIDQANKDKVQNMRHSLQAMLLKL